MLFGRQEKGISWRVSGRIEVLDGVAPLPLTSISKNAEKRLRSWGIPKEMILALRQMVSSFRYDLCSERMTRIAGKGGYILDDEGTETIVLPMFYDRLGGMDGQCGDLAIQLLHRFNFSGYLEAITTEKKIYPCYIRGNSRTHFVSPSSNHIYSGLLCEGELYKKMVVVDPSFQLIETFDESGYKIHMNRSGKEEVYINPAGINKFDFAERIRVGWIERYADGSSTPKGVDGAVLGVSRDRQVIFSLGFVREGEVLLPMVVIVDSKGNSSTQCYLDHNNEVFYRGENRQVGRRHWEEAVTILRLLATMPITAIDNNRARELIEAAIFVKY